MFTCPWKRHHLSWPIRELKDSTADSWAKYRESRRVHSTLKLHFLFSPPISLNHLLGTEEFYVQKTRQSVLAHVSNAAAIFSSVLLSALGVHAFSKRTFSLKSLFAVVTLVGILTATFSWGHSL